MEETGLQYKTVTPLLKKVLQQLMNEPLFAPFRLVGGTNLSLRYGHRLSVDIDLFTDSEYRSLDFASFENYLRSQFPYYDCNDKGSIVGMGRSYYIGNSKDDYVKVDLMYTDPFIGEVEILDGIRMASVDDIVAMKMNVVSRGGRKKDFWDLHYLLGIYSLSEMFNLHEKRHEWEHNADELLRNFIDFSVADEMPDPICLLEKDWDDIKLDLIEIVENMK
ncbi:putative nucleotidyltransferase component of viral defense system [Parabacteroides sp. PFB2-10]|uniref:nucleotidyl transferase AbiEii/AbiGii toxin family protein n=1 Tax=Parabacteroides sp. PFB2-10 TaxID=1742405 RepID=UPI0024746316|nr:nucleotidyl transferase AbiEii/AbiGii toxin family protein [Parabacteroides sp. PFB2-10]MDH6314249.1 putative nucleotidyltransferase component of viral defense system [Parabacteroides sp. PFB2-10]MDL2244276.1 nucleotidyl transferase AbiEii/AbiGii toxin family protein [Parabacteroides sp. OttesenSCG-928-J18]